MKTIYLHGRLAEFGKFFELDVNDPAEAIRALSIQIPEFRSVLAEGQWSIVKGNLEEGCSLSEEELMLSGSYDEIHILPAISGSGGKFGQIILGTVLIGAAIFTAGGSLAVTSWGFGAKALGSVGAGLVLGGVSQMLIQAPSTSGGYADRESPDERPSFLFDGPVNTSTQGLPVPLIYGEVMTGSVVVSAGMTAEDIGV